MLLRPRHRGWPARTASSTASAPKTSGAWASDPTVATTRQGLLRGTQDGDTTVWKGVRFAEAPTGPHRFAPPRPVQPWDGVRDATAFGDEPLQVVAGGPSGATTPQSEDCLFLNVWLQGTTGRRPVIVWIPGGGFINGAGSLNEGSVYDGSVYARRADTVFVTINYRLNAFGYLHQPDRPGSGAGLLDQIEALHWVRANIAAFGGDPDNITVMGESAGGMSLGVLLGTPQARGLFRRAIVQSGGVRPVVSPQGIDFSTETIVKLLGLDPAEQLIDVPAQDLLAAASTLGTGNSDVRSEPFHPVVDGVVLRRHPLDRLTSKVEVLIGTCDKDYIPGQPWSAQIEYGVRHAVGDAGHDRILAAYTATLSPGRDPKSDLLSSAFVQMPSIWLAEALLRDGATVRQYTFDYADATGLGPLHASDVPYTFGAVRTQYLAPTADPVVAQGLADKMVDAFSAFARSGDPSTPALPEWPAITWDDRRTMSFDAEPRLKEDRLPAERRAAWDGGDPHSI
ncbi:carboxylesterase/lipase family protein [Streptomyces sp. NPDC059477]|uniref:carboxylesterase/lipase family protein n=1 Tax=Streptomyces sp. NPDC059477 TaxID=3346847 RepID=UPI00367B42C8